MTPLFTFTSSLNDENMHATSTSTVTSPATHPPHSAAENQMHSHQLSSFLHGKNSSIPHDLHHTSVTSDVKETLNEKPSRPLELTSVTELEQTKPPLISHQHKKPYQPVAQMTLEKVRLSNLNHKCLPLISNGRY